MLLAARSCRTAARRRRVFLRAQRALFSRLPGSARRTQCVRVGRTRPDPVRKNARHRTCRNRGSRAPGVVARQPALGAAPAPPRPADPTRPGPAAGHVQNAGRCSLISTGKVSKLGPGEHRAVARSTSCQEGSGWESEVARRPAAGCRRAPHRVSGSFQVHMSDLTWRARACPPRRGGRTIPSSASKANAGRALRAQTQRRTVQSQTHGDGGDGVVITEAWC